MCKIYGEGISNDLIKARYLKNLGGYHVGGKLEVISLPLHFEFKQLRMTPREIRSDMNTTEIDPGTLGLCNRQRPAMSLPQHHPLFFRSTPHQESSGVLRGGVDRPVPTTRPPKHASPARCWLATTVSSRTVASR